ncbi:MAG: hypothetical protein AAFQ27_07560 [Pseudomonadota bacterium]
MLGGDGLYYVSFDGVARFEIAFRQKTVTLFDIAEDASAEAIAHLLNDHVAPRILAGAGDLVIHASAVEIEGQLAVFLGETGSGKSTLAASLHNAGHRLLGDDAIILETGSHGVVGQSVYPSLRLYPESITAVLDEAVESAPMAHYSKKHRLNMPAIEEADSTPTEVGAFFFLVDDSDDEGVAAHAIAPALTCMGLIENSFALDSDDAATAEKRFQAASQVVECVPGFELSYPWDFDLLPKIHAEIASCLQR